MRQNMIFIDPVAVDADGLAVAQAVAGAGALTLAGALTSGGSFTGDYARRLGILSSGVDTGITFLVTGTDADGKAQTETVTGASSSTAETVEFFKTVSSVVASGAAAANVSVGTVDEFVTNTVPLNTYNSDPATVSLEGFSGTINVSLEQTLSRVQWDTINWIPGPSWAATVDRSATGDLHNHASGVRLVCNSHSTSAELYMVINQNRCA